MIVMKFGGTSVESAEAITRVVGIVADRLPRHPIVVVSAMGKTTNHLLEIADEAARGNRQRALELTQDLHLFHVREARQLVSANEQAAIEAVIWEHFKEIEDLVRGLSVLGELTPRSVDAISAYGERLSSLIVSQAFRFHGISAEHVDSRDVLVTDHRHTQAAPIFDLTYERVRQRIPPLVTGGAVVVMGGFIAATEDGITTTLGRGGSDFSASIIGAGLPADEIQIWTDVDGMLTCDPRICDGGHRVRTISFAEAAELAYFGAKVLHPATVLPAIEKNIPVLILNSRRPQVEGTRIVNETVHTENVAKSIAAKRGITLLNIVSSRMLMAHGFLRRIFEVFDRHQTPVDMVATSEVSVSLTIDNARKLREICDELVEFSEVSVESDQAIVCLVGENIRHTPGVARRVFAALGRVNIRMISQGASLLNLGVVIAEADLRVAVSALHSEFFGTVDPLVFE